MKWGICHTIHLFAKANDKFMNGYDENKDISYIKFWNVNNLYGWGMS